jgi:citrate lyase subunit beta/citryl-CoA lyase
MTPPLRSALYVPGDRPDRFETARASEADAIVLDLEDAVAPDRKAYARGAVAQFATEARSKPKPVFVRVNGLASGLTGHDLDALAGAALAGVRAPKVEGADDVAAFVELLEHAGIEADLWCLLESARGVEHAYEIACCARVAAVGLGEADLRASLRVRADAALDYARSRCVIAARAAGLPPPMQAVHTTLRDSDGLRRSTEHGRALGFFGRSAIHPEQVAVINEVFTPSAEEVAAAHEVASAGERSGASSLPDGRFVDRAVAEQARAVIDLAERLSGASG